MKKIAFALFGLFLFFTTPIFGAESEWVYITKQSGIRQNEALFTDFVTPAHDTYIFVINMMEPAGGFADIVLQASTDSGETWVSTYTGGATSINSRNLSIRPEPADSEGIPVTNIKNQGFYFIGEIRLLNVHSTPIAVDGEGLMGNQNNGSIYGTLGFTSGINTVRFVSKNPDHPQINRYDITLYGLKKN
jgi:hypothetical protein